MKSKSTLFVVSMAAMIAALPLQAHHSFSAEFDAKRPLKLEGVVTKMEWINPHAWIHIDVKEADGSTTSWMIEAGTPNTLFRRGFTKDSLAPGTIISVEGYQAKNGTKRANGQDVKLPDGRTLFLGSSGTGAPSDSTPNPKR